MSDNFETKPQNLIFTKLAFKFVFVEEKFKRSIKNPLSISRVAALTIAGALTACSNSNAVGQRYPTTRNPWRGVLT